MRKYIALFLLLPFFALSQVQYGQTLFGDVANELLGIKPAYSADNSRMVILDNIAESGSVVGHARVFDLIDNTWVQIGQEIFPLSIGEHFAENISLSSDGTTLAAGAPKYDNNESNTGYVRVFTLINNQWEIKGSILEGLLYNYFGSDISLSADGNMLACSATGHVTHAEGYVKIFEYINNDWVETGIINEVLDSELIGYKVILTPNGNTIALSTYNSELGSYTGQVRVYEKVANNWVQKGSGFSGLEEGDFLGEEISISDDGTILAIGAPRHDFEGSNMGYINLYKYENDDWVLFGEQLRGNNNNDSVGRNFTLSPDGTRLAVGYYLDDTNATNSGKMVTYDLTDALSIKELNDYQFRLFPNPTKSQFTIQLNILTQLQIVTIYNTLGQVVLTSKHKIINTSKLASGSYIVEVLTNKGKSSKQLIIE